MSDKEISVRYTDEQYVTRAEMVEALHTSLVDFYWRDTLAYRAKFTRRLALHGISNTQFYLTATQSVYDKIALIEQKITRYLTVYSHLDLNSREQVDVMRAARLRILKSVAAFNNVTISELSIKAMLNGTYRETNPDHASIIAYNRLLDGLVADGSPIASEDFLAKYYSILLNQSELTKFYRLDDWGSKWARVIINRDYDFAPYALIDDLMLLLFNFIGGEQPSVFVRAIGALYFIDYIKPFDSKNTEMACVFAKGVLSEIQATTGLGLLPLENILVGDDRYKKLALETQRTGDLTYIILYAIDILDPLLDTMFDEIQKAQENPIREEFNTLAPEEEKAAQEQGIFGKAPTQAPVQASIFDSKEASEPLQASVQPTPVQPTAAAAPKPVEVVSVPTAKIVQSPVSQAAIVAPSLQPSSASPSTAAPQKAIGETFKTTPGGPAYIRSAAPVKEELAITLPESGFTDKEAKEYARYIMETNPSLRKGQAVFFATHCALGRYYTIQQFKRTIHCAYETARTSMDKLAAEGFYKKLQIKNKFVYTPIKQGEGK